MTGNDLNTSIFSDRRGRRHRGRRVLICIRGRCAPPEQGQAVQRRLLALIRQHGLGDPDHPRPVTCRTVQCLGLCEDGPVMTVHPGAVRYRLVDEPALERIFHEHLLQGNPVVDLISPLGTTP